MQEENKKPIKESWEFDEDDYNFIISNYLKDMKLTGSLKKNIRNIMDISIIMLFICIIVPFVPLNDATALCIYPVFLAVCDTIAKFLIIRMFYKKGTHTITHAQLTITFLQIKVSNILFNSLGTALYFSYMVWLLQITP